MSGPTVVYDACVLYSFHLRNLLVQLAVERVVEARWTDAIHTEWMRSLAARGRVTLERLARTRDLMKTALPEADVQGWERHLATLALPDDDDRHVLAAAIEGRASIILTWDVKHFPASVLAPHRIEAVDPDRFLAGLYEQNPTLIVAVLDAARSNLRLTLPNSDEYLAELARQGLRVLASRIRAI